MDEQNEKYREKLLRAIAFAPSSEALQFAKDRLKAYEQAVKDLSK